MNINPFQTLCTMAQALIEQRLYDDVTVISGNMMYALDENRTFASLKVHSSVSQVRLRLWNDGRIQWWSEPNEASQEMMKSVRSFLPANVAEKNSEASCGH